MPGTKGYEMSREQIEQMCIRRTGRPPLSQEEKRELNRIRCLVYYAANKERMNQQARDWYADHREEATQRNVEAARRNPTTQARVNAWKRAHPDSVHIQLTRRRTRLRGAFVEDVDRRIVLEGARGVCGWCSEPVDPTTFHVDHIVALVHGGEHSYANTQPVHPACNYEKRTVLKERAA